MKSLKEVQSSQQKELLNMSNSCKDELSEPSTVSKAPQKRNHDHWSTTLNITEIVGRYKSRHLMSIVKRDMKRAVWKDVELLRCSRVLLMRTQGEIKSTVPFEDQTYLHRNVGELACEPRENRYVAVHQPVDT